MFNFKMVNWDIVIEDNNIALIQDDEALLQSITENFNTNVGEWFLNSERGLRKYDILGQKLNQDEVIDLISESIFQNELVDRIEKIDVDFDRKNRKLVVTFEIVKKTNETVVGRVEV